MELGVMVGGTAKCPGLCNVGHVSAEQASKQSAEEGKSISRLVTPALVVVVLQPSCSRCSGASSSCAVPGGGACQALQ